MKVAYFTPLNPMQSGISDWAEELLPYLKTDFEIHLYVDNIEPGNEVIKSLFQIHDLRDYEANKRRIQYDVAIFQAGNSSYHDGIMDVFMKHGGVLELHDVSMHNYLAARTVAKGDWDTYEKVMKACHGKKGEKKVNDLRQHLCPMPWEAEPLKYTVTRNFIERADAVIVHADFARQMVKGIAPDKNVYLVPLHTGGIENDPGLFKASCREQLSIADDILMFGSFGMAIPNKRIVPALHALSRYKMISKRKFHYYIVGQNKIADLEEMIERIGLRQNVTVTGRVDLETFKYYMGACDIAFNLRYPTQGESSASLQRLLGYGKAVIVTDVGSFAEYPEDFVLKSRYNKHEENDLLECICRIACVDGELERISQSAIAYAASNFSLEVVANSYKAVIIKIAQRQRQVDYLEDLADNIDYFGIDINLVF